MSVWIAVQVETGKERIAAQKIKTALTLAGIEREVKSIFVPVQKVAAKYKTEAYEQVLLPGYVLIECYCLDAGLRHVISRAYGVFNNSLGRYRVLNGCFTEIPKKIREACKNVMVEYECPEEEKSWLLKLQAKLKELVIITKKNRTFYQLPKKGLKKYLRIIQKELSKMYNISPENIKERLYLDNLNLAL